MRETLFSTRCAGAGYIHGPTRYHPAVRHLKNEELCGRGYGLVKV